MYVSFLSLSQKFVWYRDAVRIGQNTTTGSTSAKLSMMSGQSSSPVMHDAREDSGQKYLKANIVQSLALVGTAVAEAPEITGH